MKIQKIHLSVLIIAVSLLHYCDCIKCFQCNSYFDIGCQSLQRDHIWSRFYQECEEFSVDEKVFCRRTHLSIKGYGKQDHQRIIRSCGWLKDSKNRSCYGVQGSDHFETVCQCSEDGCNAGSINLFNYFFIGYLAIFFIIF